jgi:hypothetical protein
MKKFKGLNESMKPVKLLAFLFLICFVVQSCDNQMADEIAQSASEKSTMVQTTGLRTLAGDTIGYQGIVYNAAITQTVPNAVITFSRTDINQVITVISDAYGTYKVTLAAASYYVTATAVGYNSYSSAPGYFVVTGVNGYQTGNFFLDAEVASGFQGFVFNANDFNITIPNTYITFTSSANPSLIYSVYSEVAGNYKINLPAGGYYVTAQASGYNVYDTTPGLFVVTGTSYQTGNFFLTPLRIRRPIGRSVSGL